MLIVGLTGNYGMGKSTVLDIFRELGAVTIKTDGIVRSLLNDPEVLRKIREVFGNRVFRDDGSLNRSSVASLVFRDEKLRDDLERLLHPLVFQEIGYIIDRIGRESSPDKVVIIEIPLLFEKEYAARFRKTITVYADQETAIKRLEKSGISRSDSGARLGVQMPIAEKMRRADFCINNSGTIEETRAQVKLVYDRLLGEVGR